MTQNHITWNKMRYLFAICCGKWKGQEGNKVNKLEVFNCFYILFIYVFYDADCGRRGKNVSLLWH